MSNEPKVEVLRTVADEYLIFSRNDDGSCYNMIKAKGQSFTDTVTKTDNQGNPFQVSSKKTLYNFEIDPLFTDYTFNLNEGVYGRKVDKEEALYNQYIQFIDNHRLKQAEAKARDEFMKKKQEQQSKGGDNGQAQSAEH